MTGAPTASVIVSTYNGEKHLGAALDSLLAQTFADFELIVVDDGSTDHTGELLGSLKDPRVVVLRHDHNLGIAASQNDALKIAKGEIIVLQDHDDLSQPTRLESQMRFLERNPEIALVGSSCLVMDSAGNIKDTWTVPCQNVSLKWNLLFLNPFLHTSAAIRRTAVESVGGYSIDAAVRFVEDYDLISRIARRFDVANVAEPLVCWREHSGQVSAQHRQSQIHNAATVSLRNIEWLLEGDILDIQSLETLRTLLFSPPEKAINLSSKELRSAIISVTKLEKAFRRIHQFEDREINSHLRNTRWLWGKHLLALLYQQNGKRSFRCRLDLLLSGVRMLGRAALV